MVILILCCLVAVASSQPQICKQKGKIHLQNRLFTKELHFSESTAAPVRVCMTAPSIKADLFDHKKSQPLFEFIINHTRVRGSDAVWQYKDHSIRKLSNQGRELVVIFKAAVPHLQGLEIALYQQLFSNIAFIREKIELRASGNHRFALNTSNDELCFKFPCYSLNAPHPISTEIRIASWAAELIEVDKHAAPDERNHSDDHDLGRNHMFHPQVRTKVLKNGETVIAKGPIQIISTEKYSWITAYEHASQDNLKGLLKSGNKSDCGRLRDNLQGVRGDFDMVLRNSDFHFLGIAQHLQKASLDLSVNILRGGYFDGELITADHPYTSIWTGSGVHAGSRLDSSKSMIHDYLYRCICEKPASRQPHFYYNTWGMQRSRHREGEPLRGIMTFDTILAEIRRAADLNVDIFVLDDGWEEAQGVWRPHPQRLPKGLAPIKAELDKHGMMLGVWFSPMGIDSTTERYHQHPQWVIRDSRGKPIRAQWGHPAFDFVSNFFDLFISDCKILIDQGVRFFKWDAINTFFSTLPDLDHGNAFHSVEERRARYEYLLPLYVTRAMKILTDYEPDLIIEIDLTEARRTMAGLALLSQGKYFWMNNGASWYDDYSTYRTKSMRTIANRFAGLVPLELFTFACYPHNRNKAQRYNVNTILISGHGLWGDLQLMNKSSRLRIGKKIAKAKKILPYIAHLQPAVNGRVGASPELYTIINHKKAAGQIIAFSGSAMTFQHRVALNSRNLLAVLNHAYRCDDDTLTLNFQFPMPDATREAFVLPNRGSGVVISASSSWLDKAEWIDQRRLEYKSATHGRQTILWPRRYGSPRISASDKVKWIMRKDQIQDHYMITIELDTAPVTVFIDRVTQNR